MNTIKENDVIPILKRLVNIRTENPPGITLEAINYLSDLFDKYEIKNTIQEYQEGKANIIAEVGEGDKTIILTGHLDTVPAGDVAKWKYSPFSGEDVNGKIYGRGTTDMKGAVAAFVAILLKIKELKIPLDRRIIFLGTSDEEIGMDGALVAKEKGVMTNCEFVVIGEPTELKLAVAEKGTLWFKIKITGVSAHGSTPHLGINAIDGASKLIPRIKEVVPDFEHKILGKSTLNIGKITGGTLINVVPEYCEIECDLRLVADNLREETKKKIEEIIKQYNIENQAKASIELIHEIPAIELKEENAFFNLLKNKAAEKGVKEIIGVNYGTDGAMLIPEYNTPFVIMGPGKLNQLHVTDEYTEKKEVIDYANIVYDALIERFSSKK